jgi:hypothetical protein
MFATAGRRNPANVLLIILLTLPGLSAGCAGAQRVSERAGVTGEAGVDLSADEAVIAEMQKRVDAEGAERAAGDAKLEAKLRAASRLEAKDVCIERPKESAKVVVVGFFRHDYGCHFEGAFVGPRYYEATEHELHQAALESYGWRGANREGRERLALAWVEKGLLAFFDVPHTSPKGLERFDFHPPRAASAENGAVKVTLWFRVPPGRNGGRGFQHVEYRFNGDGSLSGVSTLDAVQL